jgi:hypothetical protein
VSIKHRSLLEVRKKCGADVGLDHHLVGADIRLKIALIKKNASNVKLSTRFYIFSNAEDQDPMDMSAALEVIENNYDEISDKLL